MKTIGRLLIVLFLLFATFAISENNILLYSDGYKDFTLIYQDSSVTIYHYKDVVIENYYTKKIIDDWNYYLNEQNGAKGN